MGNGTPLEEPGSPGAD